MRAPHAHAGGSSACCFGVRRQNQARHLTRRPDMDRAERSTGTSSDPALTLTVSIPSLACHRREPHTAQRVTGHRASAVRRARPGLRRALSQPRTPRGVRTATCRTPMPTASGIRDSGTRKAAAAPRRSHSGPHRTGTAPVNAASGMRGVLGARVRTIGMQPARCARRAGIQQVRPLDPAAVEHTRAARIEGAARWNGIQPRHRTVDLRAGARRDARATGCCPSGPRCRDAPDA